LPPYATHELQSWQLFAETTARNAGLLLRDKLAEPRQIKSKGFRDLVTDADFAAQTLITDRIRAQFPAHGFLVEEEDSTLPRTGTVRWIIDPLDGTSNYSRSIPVFCVSIAATYQDELVVGVIYDPLRDELFSAARGTGSTINGKAIQVNPNTEMANATLSFDFGRGQDVRNQSLAALGELAHAVRTVRAVGSSALALAWVAAGRLDAYFNYRLSAWDIAAGALLIEEAGGCVTNFADEPVPMVERTSCLGSNGRLHRPLLAKLG